MVRSKFGVASEALDLLSVGFLLADADGKIICVNRAAADCLSSRDGLCDEGGFIATQNEAETYQLRLHIREAVEGGASTAVLARCRKTQPHTVTISPFPGAASRLALIGILALAQQSRAYVDRVARTYRLAPSEADIVTRLAFGADLPEIAASRGVSVNTVRSQLVGAKVKMGVHRQPEIVAAVSRLAILM